jgi:hypothetical protein
MPMAGVLEHRKAMEDALRASLGPVLREAGFKGAFPNWRRTVGDRIDLVGIQHLSSGGTFFINTGQIPADGFKTGWMASIPVEKLRLSHAKHHERVQP